MKSLMGQSLMNVPVTNALRGLDISVCPELFRASSILKMLRSLCKKHAFFHCILWPVKSYGLS